MEPVQALRRSVIETYIALARCSPGAQVEHTGSAYVSRSAIRHPIGNFAIGFSGTGLPHEIVKEAVDHPFFRLFFLSGDSPSGLEEAACQAGLRFRYELAGMTLVSPNALEANVHEAEGSEVAEVARFIADTFFWRSGAKNRDVLAQIMAAAYPKHRFFYEVDSQGILAAGTLTLDAECIGLYNLCVRDGARSRGVGAALAAELSRRAQRLASNVALLCDDSLVPWYSRQGFTQVGSVRAFSA